MFPGIKLVVGGVFVASAIGYLAYVGAANSWQYYLAVDEAVADAGRLEGCRLRVSGHVAGGSLSIGEDRHQATFDLAGERHSLHVTCNCLLPDNLVEDIDVVVEGVFEEGVIRGEKVMTRCASKYESADTAAADDEAASTPAT